MIERFFSFFWKQQTIKNRRWEFPSWNIWILTSKGSRPRRKQETWLKVWDTSFNKWSKQPSFRDLFWFHGQCHVEWHRKCFSWSWGGWIWVSQSGVECHSIVLFPSRTSKSLEFWVVWNAALSLWSPVNTEGPCCHQPLAVMLCCLPLLLPLYAKHWRIPTLPPNRQMTPKFKIQLE